MGAAGMMKPLIAVAFSVALVSQASAQDSRSTAQILGMSAGSAVACGWDTASGSAKTLMAALTSMKADRYVNVAKAAAKVEATGCNFANAEAKEHARGLYMSMKTSAAAGAATAARPAEDTILRNCKAEWKENYEMIEYCVKKQRAAKERLGID